MPTCEYCGDHFPKGGALTTHERNCDDRPEPGGSDDETAPIDGDGQPTPPVQEDARGDDEGNILQFAEDEFEDILETVKGEARAGAKAEVDDRVECPGCGGSMSSAGNETRFITEDGDVVYPSDGDHYCGACDGLLSQSGTFYEGGDLDALTPSTPPENGDVNAGGGGGWLTVILGGLLAVGALALGMLGRRSETQDSGGPDVF